MTKIKLVLISTGAVIALVFIMFVVVTSTVNNAIRKEEQIKESESAINVQENKRADTLVQLADSIKSYNKFESNTMQEIIKARGMAQSGDADGAALVLSAVVEQYPELKSYGNYDTYNKTVIQIENQIGNYRENYNSQVKAYKKFTRTIPNSWFLGMAVYEVIDYKYLEYDNVSETPRGLQDETITN